MRIRYIAIGIASWDNGLADILPQNLPNKLKREKKSNFYALQKQSRLSFV